MPLLLGISRSLTPLRRPRVVGGVLGLTLGGVLGCGHDTTGPAPRDPATLPWTLTLNYHAVTLLDSGTANVHTVQLVPTLQSVTGTALPATGATVTYRTTDASSAVVTDAGLVTARGVTPLVEVIATASLGGVSVADTARIQVNAVADVGNPPPVPTRLVLQGVQNPVSFLGLEPTPSPGTEGLTVDCEIAASGFIAMRDVGLTTQILAGSTPLSGAVAFTSSDPAILTYTPDQVGFGVFLPYINPDFQKGTCGKVGTVTITATALVYGVPLRDSLQVTLVPSLWENILVWQHTSNATGTTVNDFTPGMVTIGVGGIVMWELAKSQLPVRQDSTIDVVFDQPPALPQGVDTSALMPRVRSRLVFPYEAAGGDIAPFAATIAGPTPLKNVDTVSYRARQFPVPGTYHYHSAQYHTQGTIVVRPWTAP